MKVVSYFILILFILSCKTSKKSDANCNDKVINALKSLSKSISMNIDTKVYTLEYSTLHELSDERYNLLCDSIGDITHLPCDRMIAKHYLYKQQLKNLLKLNCDISIKNIRKYFGKETMTGTKYDKITHLFYYFNNTNLNCYDRNSINGRYGKCSLLTFIFDSDQQLIEIDPFEL